MAGRKFTVVSLFLFVFLCAAWPSEAVTPIEINVKDYGAVCNGTVNDAVALQAAFNAADATDAEAVVLLPPTTCLFSTPLVIGNRPSGGGSYSHVSIRGVSEDLSWLYYTGPNDQAAFQVRHVGYFTMEKFSVLRQTTNRGTSIGILLDCSTVVCGSGTQTLTGTFSHLGVSGFNVGLQIGNQAAASEISCHRCVFSWNDAGVVTRNQNTLNIYFTAVGLAFNGCGMNLLSDGVTVYGGDSSGNTTADFCGSAFGHLIIEDFRAELPDNVPLLKNGMSIEQIHIRNSLLTHADPSDVLIYITAESSMLENNLIQGRVQVGAGDVNMRGNRVANSPPLGPVAVTTQVAPIRVVLENNRDYYPGPTGTGRYPDVRGLVSFDQFSPAMEFRADVSDPGGNLDLRAVRGLAYGSPAARGENLRDAVTFTGGGTASFTFVRSVPVTTVAGSTQITFASGALTKADIGKKIQIPDVLTNCPSNPPYDDDWYGRVKTIESPTTASILPGIWNGYAKGLCKQDGPDQSETQTATIGVNEPDANYLIVGLACDRNETFWVSSVAATGFTLASSNPSSTATCSFMVVR